MQNDKFYKLGELIYKWRWSIVVFYFILLLVCIPFVSKVMSQFVSTGFADPHSESAKTDILLDKKLGYRHNQFIVLYHGPHLFTKNLQYSNEIKQSLSGLKQFPIKTEIIYPDANEVQISQDKHSAYALVLLKDNEDLSEATLKQFKNMIRTPQHLTMKIGGEPIFLDDTKQQTQKDLMQAELIASPIAVATLLVVFGTVISAFVPLILDGVCALFILILLYLLVHYFALSIFTLNIALLLGLCLSLDYALLIISRFREELHHGQDVIPALATTMTTAGKAVFFSGLAVLISLSALLLFPINILFSVGMGGITAVAVALFVSIILLPAILAILQRRINSIAIRIFSTQSLKKTSHWQWLVSKVLAFPRASFLLILSVLIFCGYPFLSVLFGLSDYRILPPHLESRQVFDQIKTDFNATQLTPLLVVVKSKKNILQSDHIATLYRFTQNLKKDPRVDHVDSIVSEGKLTLQQYQTIYSQPKSSLPPNLQQLLKLTTHENLTLITVFSKYSGTSPKTEELVYSIRQHILGKGMTLQVSGPSANKVDVFHTIAQIFPYALLWIVVLTYLILLVLLRSLFLPLKAILMTVLSLCASYGVLVLIVQEGYLADFLHFQAQGMLDVSLLIIIFCALFGFSMDYEVFLLSSIKEYYEQTGDNVKSIRYGITRTSKIITSAAIIVILICLSFITANVLLIKAFGLGIAVAIFVDAFLVRTILVPATMMLLDQWNWYLPRWIAKWLPALSFNPKEYRE